MRNIFIPVFLEAEASPADVESTSEKFDLPEEAWAAFDFLCDVYNIHEKMKPKKKYARTA